MPGTGAADQENLAGLYGVREFAGVWECLLVRIARLCFFKLGTILRDGKEIHGNFPGFSVDRELQAVSQQLLDHPSLRMLALIRAKLRQSVCRGGVHFRGYVVAFRIEPIWPS